jgi:elongation factor 1-beta
MTWDLSKKGEAAKLNEYLLHHSYVEGYTPSGADVAVYNQLAPGAVDAKALPNLARWYEHIASFSVKARSSWKGAVSAAAKPAASPKAAASPKKEAKPKDDDDDFDFGDDDDEEEGPSAEEIIKKKQEEAAKASHAPSGGKSSVILDIKPWGLETDMAELEKQVRGIEMEGLRWAGSQFEKVAYGIQMLRINAVVADDLVSIDELQEKIADLEEWVQSSDIFAFNKL